MHHDRSARSPNSEADCNLRQTRPRRIALNITNLPELLKRAHWQLRARLHASRWCPSSAAASYPTSCMLARHRFPYLPICMRILAFHLTAEDREIDIVVRKY